MLIGYNDDTDILAGIPMSTVYPTVTQYPTSSAKSAMTVSFSHEDVEDSQLHFDYVQLDFNPKNFVKGLVDVVFQKLEAENTYKIVEVVGGYDRTEEFGSLIADGAAEVMNNVTSATYSDGIITIVPKAGAVPSLKAPSVLYEKRNQRYRAGVMKVDNVTFVEVAVKGMTKEEFINAHIKVVWQELKEADRKKKLSEVYDAITK